MKQSKKVKLEPIIATEFAVGLFGSKAELARSAGVTRQSVNKWGEWVPAIRMPALRRYKIVRDAIAKYT